jgi:hypothetical protein
MITTIYKVAGDSNEYHSEQEAMVAETIQKLPFAYLSAGEKQEIAEAICKKYLLIPIPFEVSQDPAPWAEEA